jgi:hypothetical protein
MDDLKLRRIWQGTCPAAIAALALSLAAHSAVRADDDDEEEADDEIEAREDAPRAERSLLELVSHSIFQPFWLTNHNGAEPFRLPSKYYGPWQPTEVFGRDARCAPTPFAPRGYGFPKKLSLYRMEYTPYRLSDCPDSIHGPAMWMRHHRDPCCDASAAGHDCCCLDRSVDPQ